MRRFGRRLLASQVLRLCLTACGAVGLVAYGIANRLAVESFIGLGLALYTGYGVWLILYGLRNVKYELRINGPSHSPFHMELSSYQQLSSPIGLPRLFLRVTTCWERVHTNESTYEQVNVLLVRGKGARSWTATIPDLPTGVYRHKETRTSTGDLWGWFVKVRVFESTGVEVAVVSEAAHWTKEASKELPHGMNTEGAFRYEHSREEGELTAELRAYRVGDGSRAIHWRQYMKSRQLAVRLRQPEASCVMTVAIDDAWTIRSSSEDEDGLQGAAFTSATGEWLWLAWLQGWNVQVLWLKDGAMMTDKQQIACELIHRCQMAHSRSEDSSISMERLSIRDAVLISMTSQEQALGRLQRMVRSCHVHTWVMIQHEA